MPEISSFCPYQPVCGGCPAFNDDIDAYKAFKRRMAETALSPLAAPDVRDVVFIPAGTRRRVTFALDWHGPVRRFGLNMPKSHKVVEMNACACLKKTLSGLIVPLRSFFTDKKRRFLKKEGTGDVALTATDGGVDMTVTLPFAPDALWRADLAVFAQQNGVARVSWRQKPFDAPEPLACFSKPFVKIAGYDVLFPAGGFLQPSEEGQAVLTDAVLSFVGEKPKKVVDLFCGLGTFTLPLMRKKRKIRAVDSAADAITALARAGQGSVEVEERDLFRIPLWTDELTGVDAVVFDPPRAGAEAQCRQLAASDVPVVVAVSCSLKTFVRDAGILTGGGYVLQSVVPVDQFVYSDHLELVAHFVRKR